MKITREGQVFFPYEPCRDREGALLSLLEGTLPPEAEKELMEHVEHCPGCSSYLKLQEKVDDAFRSCFSPAPGPAAAPASVEMPKKLKVRLSEVRRDKLARWMFELGRVILFQQQEAVDTIHPGGPLVPADECFRKLGNICRISLTDPYLETAGLSGEFVKDSVAFVDSLMRSPSGLLKVENTKEALDRALAVIPDFVPAVKFLGNYHYHVKDFKTCFADYERGLNLVTEKEEKRACYRLLGVASSCRGNYDRVFYYANLAFEIRDSYEIEFDRFVNYCRIGNNIHASECIERMSRKLISKLPTLVDSYAFAVIKKWFIRYDRQLHWRFRNSDNILKAIEFIKR